MLRADKEFGRFQEIRNRRIRRKKEGAKIMGLNTQKLYNLMRLIYETGFITDTLYKLFFIQEKTKNPSRDVVYLRRKLLRDQLREFVETGFIDEVVFKGIGKEQKVYLLSKKGFRFISENKGKFNNISVPEFWKGKRDNRVIFSLLDNETTYNHLSKTKVKFWEIEHDEYLVLLKMGIQKVSNKRVIRGDIVDPNTVYNKPSEKYERNFFYDLMIETETKDMFLGIEFERSLKSRDAYLGRVIYDKIGRKKMRLGYFERRQKDPFLKACLIVCESEGLLNRLLEYLRAASLVKDDGTYIKLEKFYLIDKSKFLTMKEMFSSDSVKHFCYGKKGELEEEIKFSQFLLK